MKLLTTHASVLIATFSPWRRGKRLPTNGNLEPLWDFFVPRVGKTVLIDQVYPGSDVVIPWYETYETRKKMKRTRASWWIQWLAPLLRLFNSSGTHTVFKIRDFLTVVDCCLREARPFRLFVGLEAINGLAGIVMRSLGKIETVVYYVSDYSPQRYQNLLFNTIYLWLDRFCATHADVVWDVSPAMAPARVAAGLNPSRSAPVVPVPNALYPEQIAGAPLSRVVPYSLVFMGTLGVENGPDIAIAALPLILKRFSQAKLHVIGGDMADLERLQTLVAKYGLGREVVFHGFIAERIKVSQAIRAYAIALAPYRSSPGSPRWYGDATKIRAYMAAGLPTITTPVPPLGKEILAAGAGLIVQDSAKGIADGVIKIFQHRELFLAMRKAALAFAKNNTWEKEFTKAIDRTATYLRRRRRNF